MLLCVRVSEPYTHATVDAAANRAGAHDRSICETQLAIQGNIYYVLCMYDYLSTRRLIRPTDSQPTSSRPLAATALTVPIVL